MKNFSLHVTRIILTLFAAAVLVGISTTVQAALIHNLEITDVGNGLSGSGQITFTSLSGTDRSDVSAFSFTGIADGTSNPRGGSIHRFSFGLNDLRQIGWNVDNNRNLSIGFSTNNIALPTTTDFCFLFLINNPSFVNCRVSGSPIAGFTRGGTGALALFEVNTTGNGSSGRSSSSPVHSPVPEPSTMLLFGSGLTGLLAWRWKKSQQLAAKH